MSGNLTFTMIKPDAFKSGYSGPIIDMIEKAGFKLLAMKMISLSKETASEFYKIHEERPFYDRLCDYMSSGPIIVMKLSKENAIKDFRNLIGATNPEEAKEGTIRNLFATTIEANAIHGSDSDENAIIESDFFLVINHLFTNQKLLRPEPIEILILNC